MIKIKEVNFNGVDQFEFCLLRDSIQDIFNDTIEEYGLDIAISLFEDVKSYLEDEYEVKL